MTTTAGIGTIPAPAQITALQQVREYPAVSLLLNTTPAAELTHADALRLDALAADAVQRLRDELQPAAADPAISRLHTLIDQARHGPTSRALALYASAGSQALIRLPISVRERAVVDPTFATRDLIRALHRTTPPGADPQRRARPAAGGRRRHPAARRHLGLPDVGRPPHPWPQSRPRRPAHP